jgi:hypothetical protein
MARESERRNGAAVPDLDDFLVEEAPDQPAALVQHEVAVPSAKVSSSDDESLA